MSAPPETLRCTPTPTQPQQRSSGSKRRRLRSCGHGCDSGLRLNSGESGLNSTCSPFVLSLLGLARLARRLRGRGLLRAFPFLAAFSLLATAFLAATFVFSALSAFRVGVDWLGCIPTRWCIRAPITPMTMQTARKTITAILFLLPRQLMQERTLVSSRAPLGRLAKVLTKGLVVILRGALSVKDIARRANNFL